jgi:DNA-binding transcriptional LysR family regulator
MVSDELVAMARLEHPIFQKKSITKRELTRYPWVSPKVQGTVKQERDLFFEKSLLIESDNYALQKRIVLETDSICVGPRTVFKDEIKSKQMKEIPFSLNAPWVSSLLVRQEALLSPLVANVVSMFVDAATLIGFDQVV